MILKLNVSDLREGMYVVSLSGLHNNAIVNFSNMNATPEFIESIQGIEHYQLFVSINDEDEDLEADLIGLTSPEKYSQPVLETKQPKEEFAVEIGRAKKLYEKFINESKEMTNQIRVNKKIDVTKTEGFVSELVDSIARNPNAMLSTARMRSHDPYTFTHSIHLAIFSIAFANYLKMDEKSQHTVGMAGFFHDIGKLFIPEKILNSPYKLNNEQFNLIKQHSRLGYEHVLENKDFSDDIKRAILEHHERSDGTGYPNGKTEAEISPLAKIISISDVYDALTTNRSYKQALSPASAISIIYNMRGKHFNQELTEKFIKCIGIYPVGTLVKLNNYRSGIVIEVNPEAPLRPTIMIIYKNGNNLIPSGKLNLMNHKDLQIEHVLNNL